MSKKKPSKKPHEAAKTAVQALETAVQALQTADTVPTTKKKKQKKYQRSVKVRAAGEVAKFLVYNAKNFRGRYEGDALYSFKVDQDDKTFLDDLLDRLELDKK